CARDGSSSAWFAYW
nr:immunoglobulin heavy chain junction region [Mus musculus]